MKVEDALYFSRVAHVGSFSKAAKQLELPKSTLSRRIAKLEQELGVKLLERTTRQITLTELGQGYLRHCERILECVEEANNYLSQSKTSPSGRLRVSVSIDIAQIHMQELFADFIQQYPEIALEVELSQRMVNLVEDGFDVAIRVRAQQDSSLISRIIGRTGIGLYAHPDFYTASQIPTHPNQLNPNDCIAMQVNMPPLRFHDGDQVIEVPCQHRYKVNNQMMIQAAVLKGIGISVLSRPMADELVQQGKLISLLNDYLPDKGNIYAVYPSRDYLPARVRLFLDYLQANLANHPS